MPSESPIIKFQNVDKFYGNFQALSDISIEVKPSERMVICGPSGSGKSTLIRCINGLESHSMGKLTVDGIEVYEGSKEIISLRQNVGMVFQQFNLFPHMTALQNCIEAPIEVLGMKKEEAEEREKAIAQLVSYCTWGASTFLSLVGFYCLYEFTNFLQDLK